MEAPFTEHEELLLDLWAKGADLPKYERTVRHVAETGEVVRVLTMNSFHRLVLVNVALHYGLRVFSKLAYVEQKGPEWGPHGKAVEVKNVFICRPEGEYEAPAETLADLKNRWARLHNTGKSVKKWTPLQLASGAYARIEPLESNQQSAMSRHEVPKDLMAFIFALVSLADVARCRRVCRQWNECAARPSVWHAQLEVFVNRNEVTRKAFVAMKKDSGDAAATLRQLKLSALPDGYCAIVGCFPFFHEHGVSIPKDARPQTAKKSKPK
jgi:hypothetical protein